MDKKQPSDFEKYILKKYSDEEIAYSKTEDEYGFRIWGMDGEKAVEMARDNDNIDLILMDIRLPKMNG